MVRQKGFVCAWLLDLDLTPGRRSDVDGRGRVLVAVLGLPVLRRVLKVSKVPALRCVWLDIKELGHLDRLLVLVIFTGRAQLLDRQLEVGVGLNLVLAMDFYTDIKLGASQEGGTSRVQE